MKIGNEEVELVTDFSSLRAGMIVWSINLTRCSCSRHRYIITSPWHGGVANEDETVRNVPAWQVYPPPPCGRWTVITEESVAERHVYRVVDPLLDAKPVERAKELQRG